MTAAIAVPFTIRITRRHPLREVVPYISCRFSPVMCVSGTVRVDGSRTSWTGKLWARSRLGSGRMLIPILYDVLRPAKRDAQEGYEAQNDECRKAWC